MLDESGHLIAAPPNPAGEPHPDPGNPSESTARGPSMSLAIKGARAAVDACDADGYHIGATVIDSAGAARAMLTADGSDGSHIFVAMRKALTALARVTPNMFVEGGALPILVDGVLIGAIGVSCAAGTPIGRQDEVCAAAGLRKIKSQLK